MSPSRTAPLRFGVTCGAVAGGLCGILDAASSVFWLSSLRDQSLLTASLVVLGAAFGALLGAVGAWCLSPAAPRRALARTIACMAAPGAMIAYLLFTGGRARHVPALWLMRPLVAVALTAGASAALVHGSRAIVRLRAQSPGARAATVLISLTAAFALHAVDHRVLPRLYEYLHASLGFYTLVCAAAAVAVVWPIDRTVPWILALPVVSGVLVLAPATLDRMPNVRAELFGVHAPTVRHGLLVLEALRPTVSRAPRSLRPTAAFDRRAPRPSALEGAHIVLITIDALRADRLGHGRTPVLDALAARGVTFARTYAQAPHSSYSITSLHTSEYLHETVPLGQPQPLRTLADVLGASGYRTAALYTEGIFFTEGEQLTAYRTHELGFQRTDHVDRRADAQTDAAMLEVDDTVRRGEPPTFLWVHYFDAHEPYGGTGTSPEAQYNDAVHTVDRAIGRLLTHATQAWHRPLIVCVTADHGEEFGEHGGVYHGSSLYEEQVHVPWIVATPEGHPGRVTDPTELIDVAPTLLDLAGVTAPDSMRGRSRRAAIEAGGARVDPDAVAHAAVATRLMVARGRYKFITDLRFGVEELYDLERDPGEHVNLAADHESLRRALEEDLAVWMDRLGHAARNDAAMSRARLGDRSVQADLVQMALDDRRQERSRVEAIEALAQYDDARAVAPLTPLLARAPLVVRDAAAIALGRNGDTAAREVLFDAVARDAPSVRGAAALALARLGEPCAARPLVELFATGDETARSAAVDALGALADPDSEEALLEALDDDHQRYRAVLALGRLARPETFARLEDIAQHDRGEDVRANAVAALALANDRDALPAVRRAALAGGSQGYAAAALERLGGAAGWSGRDDRTCAPVTETLAWQWLGARACAVEGSRAMPWRGRIVGSNAWLIVRARGRGELVLSSAGEFARFTVRDGWTEWRAQVDANALPVDGGSVTVRATEALQIMHVLAVAP